jgi:hypothetical protein
MNLQILARKFPAHWQITRPDLETIEIWDGHTLCLLDVESRRVFVAVDDDTISVDEIEETAKRARAIQAALTSDWWDDAQRWFRETNKVFP